MVSVEATTIDRFERAWSTPPAGSRCRRITQLFNLTASCSTLDGRWLAGVSGPAMPCPCSAGIDAAPRMLARAASGHPQRLRHRPDRGRPVPSGQAPLHASGVADCLRGEQDRDFPYGDNTERATATIATPTRRRACTIAPPSATSTPPQPGRRSEASRSCNEPELRRCASRWGDDAVYDLVGNLDGWVDDETALRWRFLLALDPQGLRADHRPPRRYLDYSLGIRCCLSASRWQRPPPGIRTETALDRGSSGSSASLDGQDAFFQLQNPTGHRLRKMVRSFATEVVEPQADEHDRKASSAAICCGSAASSASTSPYRPSTEARASA